MPYGKREMTARRNARDHLRKYLRLPGDHVERVCHNLSEFLAKTCALGVVPIASLAETLDRRGPKEKTRRHPPRLNNWSRTTFQGDTLLGVCIRVCNSPLQLGALRVGQRERLRASIRFFSDAVPDVFDEL